MEKEYYEEYKQSLIRKVVNKSIKQGENRKYKPRAMSELFEGLKQKYLDMF